METNNKMDGTILPGIAYVAGEASPVESTPLDSYEADKNSEAFKKARKYQWAAKDAILSPEEIALLEKAESGQLTKGERSRLYQIQAKQSAKARALEAQQKRVSRRLLLATRAKNVTVVCPVTGIVSQMDIPAIKGFALEWTSPLASESNCRGMAQRGEDYLKHLDSQILAGILVVIAEGYNLFQFQPFDSGAQKNAILRTAGKGLLIDAIVMIENLIHSGNSRYLPRLSLIMDIHTASVGIDVKLKRYLHLLADAIAKPDKEEYDENYVVPRTKLPKAVKTRTAKDEADKVWSKEKTEGKQLLKALMKEHKDVNPKLIQFIAGLLTDDALLLMPAAMTEQIIQKLQDRYPLSENAAGIIAILKRDRSALKSDSLLEEDQEPKVEDNAEELVEETGVDSADSLESDDVCSDTAGTVSDDSDTISSGNLEPDATLIAPAGLTPIQAILWKKKYLETINGRKPKVYVQNDLPSVAVYTPTEKKSKLGEE